jgi:hypothetical protein
MKALLLASSMLAMVSAANAADITATRYQNDWNVKVTGEIKPGDDKKFHRVTNQLSGTVIVELNSPGGDVAVGLNIGEEIAAQLFETAVMDRCASVCGLMWLAGYHRMVKEDAHLGFHAAYNYSDGSVSPNANAVIGAYLNRLGFSYHTIDFLTRTSPDSMQWLTSDLAMKYGIDAWVFPADRANQASVQTDWRAYIPAIVAGILGGGFIAKRRRKIAAWLKPGKLTTFDKVLLGVTAVPVTILVGGYGLCWLLLG